VQQISPDGKSHFVGCSAYQRGDDIDGHRFTGIPLCVDEKLLLKVMQNNGAFKHALHDMAVAEGCINVRSCRSGAKFKDGCGMCLYFLLGCLFIILALLAEYTHIKDGVITKGELVHHTCTTRVTIYSPMDRSCLRGVVVLKNGHSHLIVAADKVTKDGVHLYEQAIETLGVTGATVGKIDKGM